MTLFELVSTRYNFSNRLHHDLSRFRCRGKLEALFPRRGPSTPPHIVFTYTITTMTSEVSGSESFTSATSNHASTALSSDITSVSQNSDQYIHPSLFAKLEALQSTIKQVACDLSGIEDEPLTRDSVDELCGRRNVTKAMISKAFKDIYLATMPLCNGKYQPSTANMHKSSSDNDNASITRALEHMQKDMLEKMSEMIQQSTSRPEAQHRFNPHPQPPSEQQHSLSPPVAPSSPPNHTFKDHTTLIPDYLNSDEQSELKELLENETYATEKGRGVLQYGAHYRYMGSKAVIKETPAPIQKILDKLNSTIPDEANKLNSILINRYTGAESYLPEHSDDELSISPTSNIYTISVGESRTVKFKEIFTGIESELNPSSGSLYTMTRDSQAVYRHRIEKDPDFKDKVRYSVTFRSVHWTNLNSTIIMGDSNSRPIEFGDGRGKVGKATPGRRAEAVHIEDISPEECVSYKNVVLLAGTNNLKNNDIESQSDVIKLAELYKDKIVSIRRLNKNCNIHITPVIPTKSNKVNVKIQHFNNLVAHELTQYFPKLFVVSGTRDFADPNGLLSDRYAKSNDRSGLHLNKFGIAHLVRSIKQSIFQGKSMGSKVHSNRAFSNAVQYGRNFPDYR